jgi:hypothetical protein
VPSPAAWRVELLLHENEYSTVLDSVQLPGRHTVLIDRSRDDLLTAFGKDTLADRYLFAGESFQDLFARVASAYGDGQARCKDPFVSYKKTVNLGLDSVC